MDDRLRRLLRSFSDQLHDLEAAGVELPNWLDAVWLKITARLLMEEE